PDQPRAVAGHEEQGSGGGIAVESTKAPTAGRERRGFFISRRRARGASAPLRAPSRSRGGRRRTSRRTAAAPARRGRCRGAWGPASSYPDLRIRRRPVLFLERDPDLSVT